MNLAVLLELLLLVAVCFGWGVIVGRGWRVFDHIEARLLDRLALLRTEGRRSR